MASSIGFGEVCPVPQTAIRPTGSFLNASLPSAMSKPLPSWSTVTPRLCRACAGVSCAIPRMRRTFFRLHFWCWRKAGTVRWRESAAGWLYEVARRLCLKVKAEDARREQCERQAAGRRTTETLPETAWRELCAVLDEELGRLPEQLRAPLLLCYLEGATHDEAARQLGWSARTLRRRLDRGRQVLHARLLGRGLGLPAAALTAGLSQQATTAEPLPLAATVQCNAPANHVARRLVAHGAWTH